MIRERMKVAKTRNNSTFLYNEYAKIWKPKLESQKQAKNSRQYCLLLFSARKLSFSRENDENVEIKLQNVFRKDKTLAKLRKWQKS